MKRVCLVPFVAIALTFAIRVSAQEIYVVGNKVGIGTNTPVDAKLHVWGDYNLRLDPLAGTSPYFYVTTNSADNIIGTNIRTKTGTWNVPVLSKTSAFINFPTYGVGNALDGSILFMTRTAGLQSNTGLARMTILNNGNVGIGTNSPSSKLELIGNDGLNLKIKVDNPFVGGLGSSLDLIMGDNSYAAGMRAYVPNGQPGYDRIYLGFYTTTFDPSGLQSRAERMTISDKGNVGIGTSSTNHKLEVNGNIKTEGISLIKWYNPNVAYTNNALVMNGVRENNLWRLYGDGARSSIGIVNTDIFGNMRFVSHYDPSMVGGKTMSDEDLIVPNTKMIITVGGNVGIGKSPDGSNKLDVAGTIRATEIKVEAATTTQLNVDGTIHAANIKVAANGQTADFVFEEAYDHKDLAEVEKYIKEHKHLPDIPSATDMETNGVDVAEMNKLLLQKVEELTLYIIDLEAKNKNEKAERESIETRLAHIESLLLQSKGK
jgi:hypothetical protein